MGGPDGVVLAAVGAAEADSPVVDFGVLAAAGEDCGAPVVVPHPAAIAARNIRVGTATVDARFVILVA